MGQQTNAFNVPKSRATFEQHLLQQAMSQNENITTSVADRAAEQRRQKLAETRAKKPVSNTPQLFSEPTTPTNQTSIF
ncbi:hypothetical protein FAES_3269 [Fibrella aestuarina BUZ 2]|uniref:Uncharacterized protein n=1 Tax=Fibrella aestuarina BUZ 2 TaxID=1166018 RepID=I0KAX5_9BACT|nr:hypothetical protein [Fibrella aestuarina]CCH01278.1 hypothetical protein FAES_3269 [Fibrella aestuarina BUZ 2]